MNTQKKILTGTGMKIQSSVKMHNKYNDIMTSFDRKMSLDVPDEDEWQKKMMV